MKEYSALLDVFSQEGYVMYSTTIPSIEWGNRSVAEKYLERYWLPNHEYDSVWKQVQNQIFINQNIRLPEMVFKSGYELYPLLGGCLFEKIDFLNLQKCFSAFSEKNFFVIENSFDNNGPFFRMKFPADISWSELMSGNFVSSIMMEMPHKDYFVFGESGKWGKYVANDHEIPVEIFGFKNEISNIFKEHFSVLTEEMIELTAVLPAVYFKSVNLNIQANPKQIINKPDTQ